MYINHLKYIFGSIFAFYISFFKWNLSIYEFLSIFLFFNYFLYFIDSIGKKIIILEIACLMAILTWLVAPIPFYHYFTQTNELAKLWVVYMPIDSHEYYSFAFWGTLSMVVGMSLKLKYAEVSSNTKPIFDIIRIKLGNKKIIGFILISLGIISNIFSTYINIPQLGFVFYLLNKLYLVGLIYLYFSVDKYNSIFLIIGLSILLFISIQKALFGEFLYYCMLTVFLVFSQSKINFSWKVVIIMLGFFGILLIQSVKYEYRKTAWKEGANFSLFTNLVVNNALEFSALVKNDAITLALLARLNQGYLIAKTMKTVPKTKPYAHGSTILSSSAAIIIPRFLWKTKPEAGGKANLERFLNLKIKGYSMNISPIGEAYGNFGKIGGIFFMFLYGLFFNSIVNFILKKSYSRPLLTLWLPFLFLYAIGTETDILSTVNYIIKAGIFLFLIYQFFRLIFNIKLI